METQALRRRLLFFKTSNENEPVMTSAARKSLRSTVRWLNFLGLNHLKVFALRYVPRYLKHRRAFRKMGGLVTHNFPILEDFLDNAGSASGHYFHQDLLVASLIFKSNPRRHIDVGSRIDGFVAHVAAFRSIEVADVRPLPGIGHDSITFTQLDLMDSPSINESVTDSLSSLHVVEHIGLGRYGDAINPEGHKIAFNNLLRMLQPGGLLYVSFPIGQESQIHFNAHRVFRAEEILEWQQDSNPFRLQRFDYVDDVGALHKSAAFDQVPSDLVYGCGIYTLEKL